MKYRRDEILKIGKQVAEKLGASCCNYTINNIGREIIFQCECFGETLEESVSFEDMKKDYGIDFDIE